MDITRYTFQSPYPNQIQIGRPDPSVKKEDDSSSSGASYTPVKAKTAGEILQSNTVQFQKVQPTVDSNLIDTYA